MPGRGGPGLEAVALRYFTVYGPGQRPDMGLRLFAEAALTGAPITLLGDGSQRRDFTYVCDIVTATVAAADAPASGLAINVGGGSDISVSEVLNLLAELVGRDLDIVVQPFARGDVRVTCGGPQPGPPLLGFEAHVPFAAGFEREVAWLRESSTARSRCRHDPGPPGSPVYSSTPMTPTGSATCGGTW